MNRRSLARDLVRDALEVMPPERRPWALAMAAELDHIDDDSAALAFASGAVWASYRVGVGLWSNWLRLGRWSVSAGTAALGPVMFYFVTVVTRRLPEAAQPSAVFNSLIVLLGIAYVWAGWCLARRKGRALAGVVALMSAMVTVAMLTFAGGVQPAISFDVYLALLRGEPVPQRAFPAALLAEQILFVLSVAGWGALFWRLESRRAGA